jgi:hypothetical protein
MVARSEPGASRSRDRSRNPIRQLARGGAMVITPLGLEITGRLRTQCSGASPTPLPAVGLRRRLAAGAGACPAGKDRVGVVWDPSIFFERPELIVELLRSRRSMPRAAGVAPPLPPDAALRRWPWCRSIRPRIPTEPVIWRSMFT